MPWRQFPNLRRSSEASDEGEMSFPGVGPRPPGPRLSPTRGVRWTALIPFAAWIGMAEPGHAAVFEPFDSDPVAAGRFTSTTTGTESTFTHRTEDGALGAVLDVDASTAAYLSAPFPAVTEGDSASFSFRFRVVAVDERVRPTAFIGLVTPRHVENFGDGLTLTLSTNDDGRPVATATIDTGGAKSAGTGVGLELGVDYLASATYSAASRRLVLDVYSGDRFTVRVGRSEAVLDPSRTLSLTHFGLQNGGARTSDSATGSITVAVDDLAMPGRPPITIFAEDVTVDEGTDGASRAGVQVLLSAPAPVPVSVGYSTLPGSATEGLDYQAVAGTLVIPAGASGGHIDIPIVPDDLAEPDETFTVEFDGALNANLASSRIRVTVRDDDLPRVGVESLQFLEGPEGVAELRIPVRLSNRSTLPVTVRYATVDGTARAGQDYRATNGVLVIPPGSVEGIVRIETLGDSVAEGNETFQIVLSEPQNAALEPVPGRVTVLDDDPLPRVDVFDTAVVEQTGPLSSAVAVVRLSNPSALPVAVPYSTRDGSAVAGTDYLAAGGTLRFDPGELEKAIVVAVFGDAEPEPVETFQIVLGTPVNAALGQGVATVGIDDDDVAPALRVGDATVIEGGAGESPVLAFTVSLWPPAPVLVTVNHATVGATATAGVDFESASGALTFPPGVTNRTVGVVVRGDDEAEPDEELRLRLDNAVNAPVARAEGVGTILTDDSVTLSVADAEVVEGDGSDRQAVFVVNLRGNPVQPVTVAYFTANGTAESGLDYRPRSALLTFQPGQTLQTVSIPVIGDFLDEPVETFELRLHEASGASLSRAVATGTIRDNDPPSLSISGTQILEGSTGPTNARVVVRLSSATFEEIRVDFLTLERTATEGVDYQPAAGTLVFPVGSTERFVDVTVAGDTLHEADEFFMVRLVSPVGATLAVPEARVTIRDDDIAPEIRIADREITECSDGTASAFFTVTLSEPSGLEVSVEYWTFDDTATAGEDYLPVRGRLVFPPGTTEQVIEVPLVCDRVDEDDETFGVGLGGGVNGSIGGDGRGGRGRIVDDDPPGLSVGDAAVDEGDEGLVQAVFLVTLSSPAAEEVLVDFFTLDDSATAGLDYAALSGQVVFAPGETVSEVRVPVIGDTLPEGDETFLVGLNNPLNASLAVALARGIIRDDDQPRIVPEDLAVVEGDDGPVDARMPVRLTRTSPQPVEVRFTTANGTAVAGQDYASGSGILRFAPGETLQEIPLSVLGDRVIEGNEDFLVRFSAPVNGVLVAETTRVTVVDNDGAPVLSVADVPVDEGQAGVRNLVFSLRLSAPSAVPVSAAYATTNVTATAGSDYVARNGTANFSPGTTNVTVAVPILGDAVHEADETFLLLLGNPVNTVLARSQAVGILRNDDPPSVLSVADAFVVEGPPGARSNLVFRVTLSPPNSVAVSVDYATLPGTATPGLDHVPTADTLVLPAGVVAADIVVPVLGDDETEGDETVRLRLGGVLNAVLEREEALGTIIDDEGVAIRVADASVTEPDNGVVGLTFAITLDRPGTQLITVDYATLDGTAGAGVDYDAASGTLFFPPGLTRQTLTVAVRGDLDDEPDETFQLRLSGPVNGVLDRPIAIGTILDDDPPAIRIDDVTVVGSQVGTVDAVFTIRLTSPSLEVVTVAYRTDSGTAAAGSDYTEAFGTLVFSPGQVVRTLPVQLKGNSLDEGTEFFLVRLDSPVNATAGRMTGRGTILNQIDPNRPPTVALTAPASGSTFLVPTNLTLTATASDPEGAVAGVEFFVGTTSLGVAPVAPFAIVWTNAPQGTHTLTAQAVDTGGLGATSAPVRITVLVPNEPPVVGRPVAAPVPEDGASPPLVFTVEDESTPASLLEVTATPLTPGLVAADGLVLGGAGAQRTVVVTPLPDQSGTARVRLLGRDTGGLTATNEFEVVILPVNDAPTLDPVADRTIPEDSPLQTIGLAGIGTGAANEAQRLTVTATSSQPALVPHPQVAYTSPQAAGTLTFRPQPNLHGSAVLTVTVRDDGGTANGGQDTVTRQFTVRITPENDPPTVQWVAPDDGSVVTAGATVRLAVDASDPDDGVALVEFLLGGEVLGQATRPPYEHLWLGVPAGSHGLVARVSDSAGATALTPVRRLTASEPAGDIPSGDILILRNGADPEVELMRATLEGTQLNFRDLTTGVFETPVVVVADPADLSLEALLAYRLVIWDDLGMPFPALGDREVDILWEAWRFGVALYVIGDDPALAAAPLGAVARQRWAAMTGLLPGEAVAGPGRVEASEPRARANELFWGALDATRDIILDDFDYGRASAPGRLVGDGEVRANLDGTPVLVRYPGAENPFDTGARRLVQSFRVAGAPSESLETRRLLFLNGVAWLLGTQCDNFLTTPGCEVEPPDVSADPCAPHVLRAVLKNNGRCEARGVILTNRLPPGFRATGYRIRSEPEGANGGVIYDRGDHVVFAIGKVDADSQVVVEVDAIAPGPGLYRTGFHTAAHYRPVVVCEVEFGATAAGCAPPRLEIRNDPSTGPEFRVAEPAVGEVAIEVSTDLIRWVPAGTAPAGQWLAPGAYAGEDSGGASQLFLRVVR